MHEEANWCFGPIFIRRKGHSMFRGSNYLSQAEFILHVSSDIFFPSIAAQFRYGSWHHWNQTSFKCLNQKDGISASKGWTIIEKIIITIIGIELKSE